MASNCEALIKQLREIIAQGEDSGSISQHAETRSTLRAILLKLLQTQNIGNTDDFDVRSIHSALRLLKLVGLEQLPWIFLGDGNAFIVEILEKLVPFLSQPLPVDVASLLTGVLGDIVTLLGKHNDVMFSPLVTTFVQLFQDTQALAFRMSVDPSCTATISVFSDFPKSLPDCNSPAVVYLTISNPLHCQAVLCHTLSILGQIIKHKPSSSLSRVPVDTLDAAINLLFGTPEIQLASLQFLTIAVPSFPASERRVRRLLDFLAMFVQSSAASKQQVVTAGSSVQKRWQCVASLLRVLYDVVHLNGGDSGLSSSSNKAGGQEMKLRIASLSAQVAHITGMLGNGSVEIQCCELVCTIAAHNPAVLVNIPFVLQLLVSRNGQCRDTILDCLMCFMDRFSAEELQRAAAEATKVVYQDGGGGADQQANATSTAKKRRRQTATTSTAAAEGVQPEDLLKQQTDPVLVGVVRTSLSLAHTLSNEIRTGNPCAVSIVALAGIIRLLTTKAPISHVLPDPATIGNAFLAATGNLKDSALSIASMRLGIAVLQTGLLHNELKQHPATISALQDNLSHVWKVVSSSSAASASSQSASVTAESSRVAVAFGVLCAQAGILDCKTSIVQLLTSPKDEVSTGTVLPAIMLIATAREPAHPPPPQQGKRRQQGGGGHHPPQPPTALKSILEGQLLRRSPSMIHGLATGLQLAVRGIDNLDELAILAADTAANLPGRRSVEVTLEAKSTFNHVASEWLGSTARALCASPHAAAEVNIILVDAVSQYMLHCSAGLLEKSRPLAEWLLSQASSESVAVRMALVRHCSNTLFVDARFLLPLYHKGSHPERTQDRNAAADRYQTELLNALKAKMEAASAEHSVTSAAEDILQLVASMGASLSPGPRTFVLAILVMKLDQDNYSLAAIASRLLESMASVQGCTVKDLLLLDPLLLQRVGKFLATREPLLVELADLLDMNTKALALAVLPDALPALVAADDRAGLESLARQAGLNAEKVLRDYGHHVFAKQLFDGSESFDILINLVEAITKEDFVNFVQTINRNTITEIVHLAGKAADWGESTRVPEAVFSRANDMFQTLASITTGVDCTAAAFLADGDVVTKMLKEFGDALERAIPVHNPAYTASKNNPNSVDERTAVITVRCITLLVELTGPFVGRFLPQLLVLLGAAVRSHMPRKVKLQGLEGWLCLVNALAQHAAVQLGGIVNQIVVSLLESLQDVTVCKSAAEVVKTVIITCNERFPAKLRTFPPLPQGVLELLCASSRSMLLEARGKLEVQDHVELLLESLNNESLNVRSVALSELKTVLAGQRSWLLSLTSGDEGPHTTSTSGNLLHRLIASLLKCCKPEGYSAAGLKAQLACAECLGMLGAVDPSRVIIDLAPPPLLCSTEFELVNTAFNKHLVRLLKTASTLQALDAATYAIQQVLKEYSSHPEFTVAAQSIQKEKAGGSSKRKSGIPPGASTNSLFMCLPDEVQAIVRPYLDSKYMVVTSTKNQQGSRVTYMPGMYFRRWITLWMSSLVNKYATGQRKKMFEAIIPVFRFDIPTCLFLLPYVVHNVLESKKAEAMAAVTKEIEAVMQNADAHTREGGLCLQAVFSLLDVLQAWIRDIRGVKSTSSATTSSSSAYGVANLDDGWQRVQIMLDTLPKETLAGAAARSGAHARALLWYETHLRANQKYYNPAASIKGRREFLDSEVTFLQDVYSKLEEPDGLEGLVRLRQGGPRPEDQRLAAEKAGSWGEALTLYEQELAQELPQQNSTTTAALSLLTEGMSPTQRGYLDCMLHMGHWQGLLIQVDGLAATLGNSSTTSHHDQATRRTLADNVGLLQLAAMGSAAAWRLGRWDQLQGYLNVASKGVQALDAASKWEVRVAQLLSSAAEGSLDDALIEELERARGEVMGPFSAAAMESYTRAYPHLVKLHMLQEVADAAEVLRKSRPALRSSIDLQHILHWDDRLKFTQSTLATQTPILALRRQLASLMSAPEEAGKCWLEHARLCRALGHGDAATSAVLQAAAAKVPGAELERLQLVYLRGEPHKAITELERLVKRLGTAESGSSKAEQKQQKAEALLVLAQWTADTGGADKETITSTFEEALALRRDWETGLFKYASYLDQLMQDARKRQEEGVANNEHHKKQHRIVGQNVKTNDDLDRPWLELLPQVVKNYGNSVVHGHEDIYQSLPRMLTLFYEVTDMAAGKKGKEEERKALRTAQKVSALVNDFFKEIPMHSWLTALPQLISRVLHPYNEAQKITQFIIAHVTVAYPQQGLWALAGIARSNMSLRKSAAASIYAYAKKKFDNEQKMLLSDINSLCEQLIKLSHHKTDNKRHLSIKREFAHLSRAMPLRVIVPITSTLTVVLPPAGSTDPNWKLFASEVTITGIHDEISVMASLMAPKKITLIGSDGNDYPFLCKPKDDLRKDNRLLEEVGVLNRLFLQEPDARRRNLYLRRFAVLPLTEECGILEWVQCTRGLRHCIIDLYDAEGISVRVKNQEIRRKNEAKKQQGGGPLMVEWLEDTLASHPPVFHKYFINRFPEPAMWLDARLAFTRTYAAWCMVGHMVGLGDRHGENILIDQSNGDAVFVDFSCLFDRGLALREPELVPFRLTQNVIDAFGPSGPEGVYRRVCEITLGVLRKNQGTIMSVLDPMIHDPFVDWAANNGPGGHSAEQDNPHAKDAMRNLEGRLNGTLLGVYSHPCMPLSVEGHVHRLILEASSKEKLSKMYIWWQAWY